MAIRWPVTRLPGSPTERSWMFHSVRAPLNDLARSFALPVNAGKNGDTKRRSARARRGASNENRYISVSRGPPRRPPPPPPPARGGAGSRAAAQGEEQAVVLGAQLAGEVADIEQRIAEPAGEPVDPDQDRVVLGRGEADQRQVGLEAVHRSDHLEPIGSRLDPAARLDPLCRQGRIELARGPEPPVGVPRYPDRDLPVITPIGTPPAPGPIGRPGLTRSAARPESSWRGVRSRRSGFHGTRIVTCPLSTRRSLSSISGAVPPPRPSLSRKIS